MMKWEYKIIMLGADDHGSFNDYLLNHQGELGWELVAVSDHLAYFKRPKE